jgi:hypothetical protein
MLALLGCSGGRSQSQTPLLRGLEDAPEGIRGDCQVAGRKCIQCHPVERIILADVDSPKHWQRYVARMRLQPASNIGKRDAGRIERCLIYRSFGAEALSAPQSGEAP